MRYRMKVEGAVDHRNQEQVVAESDTYQILRSQFSLSKMLLGFRSRWMMFAECKNLNARSTW